MTDLLSIPLVRIDGRPTTLGAYRGKVLLIVNVASACGLTPQYEGLQRLYREKRAAGLEVLGFPCNDFGAQEPGSETEIASFCTRNYGVGFPMFQKVAVLGAGRHPLYQALIAAQPVPAGSTHGNGPDVLWNFEKFVVGRDGRAVARFAPQVTPDDPHLRAALDTALAAA